jgi:hypothetical protein
MAKQTFTTGQVLTAAQMTSLQQTAMGGGDTTAKTTSYVLVAADAGTIVAMNAAGSTTITVNTGLFAAGDTVFIQNRGAGVCTITAGTATVNTHGSLAIAQYEGGQLYFTATGAAIFFDISQSTGMTNPMTTTGDTIYSSSGSTPARLGIGSTGQVLTVAAGVPSWATASAGAMTKITSATFSNVAEVNVDTVFSSTYKSYIITIKATNETSETADFYFRTRNNTPSTNTQNYSGGGQSINRAGTVAAMANDNAAQWRLTTDMGSTGVPSQSVFTINVNGVTGSTERPGFTFQGLSGATTPGLYVHGAVYSDQSNIRGFNLSASTGNITGDYQVYGLEK